MSESGTPQSGRFPRSSAAHPRRGIAIAFALSALPGCHGRCGEPTVDSVTPTFEVSGETWRADVAATSDGAEACAKACEDWAGSDTGRFEVSACASQPTADTGDSGAVAVTCAAVGVYRYKCE